MNPEDVGYLTELDIQYAKELLEISNDEELETFLSKWKYWLLDDDLSRIPTWTYLKPVLDECRTDGIIPEKKHEIAMSLLMPSRIFRVSIRAQQFRVPWGTAYIRMREAGV